MRRAFRWAVISAIMSAEFGAPSEPDAPPVFILAGGDIGNGIGYDAELPFSPEWLIELDSAEAGQLEDTGGRASEQKTLAFPLVPQVWEKVVLAVAEPGEEPDQAREVTGVDPGLTPEAEAVEPQDGWDQPAAEPDDSGVAAAPLAETFPVAAPAEPPPAEQATGGGEAGQAPPSAGSLEDRPPAAQPAAKQGAPLNAPLAFVLQLKQTGQSAWTNANPGAAETPAAELPEAIPGEAEPAASQGAEGRSGAKDEAVSRPAPAIGENAEPLSERHTWVRWPTASEQSSAAHTAQPGQSRSPTSSSGRMQEPSVILPPEEPPQPVPVSGIRLRLGGDLQPEVEVNVTARAGQVRVAVRSDDAGLGGALRSQISELVTSIERNGYRAEALMPPGEAHESHTPDWNGRREPDSGAGDHQHSGGGSGRHRQEERSGRFREALLSAQRKGANS